MAAAKIRVSDVAKRMGKSEKDLIFQLQSLGAEVSDPNQVLEPEVIQALITGKKLVTRTRSVIMREDKPQPEKKKEAVRPPRPIVKPTPRVKKEVPVEEAPVTTVTPTVIIPEFVQAAEAEERAAKEAPPERMKIAAEVPETAPIPSPAHVPAEPLPMAAQPAAGDDARTRSGPTGPRARTTPAARPNYAGQAPAVRPGMGAPRPPMGAPGTQQRPPMGARPPMGTGTGA
ncbi:MAG: translation initiation factor IF-2 N-terminal domain-containing protein, partial [Thermoanaerobaculia bacterium]